MRLYVYVLQAKDLPVQDSYVKLQVGKFKSKTRVLKNNPNPVWNEEFVFRIHEDDDDIVVSVFHHDEDTGFFNGSGDLMGRVRIPVRSVAVEENQILLPTWFPIEHLKNSKFIDINCGKILLSVSVHGKNHDPPNQVNFVNSDIGIEDSKELEGSCKSSHDIYSSKTVNRKKPEGGKQIMKAFASRFEKLFNKHEETSRSDNSSEVSVQSDYEDCVDKPSYSFEEAIQIMQSKDNDQEMPENLSAGILLDQIYIVPSHELNRTLFAPESQFMKDLAELQGTTDLKEGNWELKSGEMPCVKRYLTYTKAASKLVKAVKATEEQTYLKADGRRFAVFTNVSTPDVPYGNNFKVELLYKIITEPELFSGEEGSRLIVSWNVNFHQNTIMKSMIEGGARQGLNDSFEQFSDLLAKKFKVKDSLDKDRVLATLETEHQSDWQLGFKYFWNFNVFSAVVLGIYILVHILLCEQPSKVQGLEFYGLDLPDSFGEVFTCGILILQLERVYYMVARFVQAKLRRGSDHGVKALGEGWVLTVALIEGTDLASIESTGVSDPYVVFTCNGKTRTSSVKLQDREPQWNEVLEFDAMEDPPSVLDVEVFDFDGPFDTAASLGHAEINFLKYTSAELADLWVPLEGKLAQSLQSKLHLRIFLDNNNGAETIKEYMSKMEKEVGKKLNLRSPHKNCTFQKLFGLPPEEFLISAFTCYLKRRMPLQGRLFLSARTVGFYANLFGHKTKFFFLWEDIEDIQVVPPSLASVGSPSLAIVLRKGRGHDARHGAKSQDEEGRLRFCFQSFVSFNVACRTIMALWRTRTLSPDQRAQFAQEQQDREDSSIQEDGIFLNAEESKMSKVFSAELPVNMKSLMEMFDGGALEQNIMEKSGCLNYGSTIWEPIKSGVYERHVSYKFNRFVSIFGGEVTCVQQKTPIADDKGWILNEIMALHDVPFSDHFRVHFKYHIERSTVAHNACKCDVYLGITWLKSTKFERRITQNITEKFTNRLHEIFGLVQREILFTTTLDNHL